MFSRTGAGGMKSSRWKFSSLPMALFIVMAVSTGSVPAAELSVNIDRVEAARLKGQTVVKLFVSVTDAAGEVSAGLDQGRFTIREDGEVFSGLQEAGSFAGSDEPMVYLIALDSRDSLPTSLSLAGEALRSFVTEMGFRYTGLILNYTGQPALLAGPTENVSLLTQSLMALTPADDLPRLLDGLIRGVRELENEGHFPDSSDARKVLVVLTDGLDQGSVFSWEAAREKIRRSGLTLFVVGYGVEDGGLLPELAELAGRTGGGFFFTWSPDEMEYTLNLIANRLKKQYILTYTSSVIRFDGQVHHVRVQVGDAWGEYRFMAPLSSGSQFPGRPGFYLAGAGAIIVLAIIIAGVRRGRRA